MPGINKQPLKRASALIYILLLCIITDFKVKTQIRNTNNEKENINLHLWKRDETNYFQSLVQILKYTKNKIRWPKKNR